MKKTNDLVTAVLTIVLGLLFIILKGGVISIAMTILGVALIVLGIMDIVKKNLTSGIIKAVIGVAIIVCGWLIVSVVLYIVAALLLIYGIMGIIQCVKNHNSNASALDLVMSYAKPVLYTVAGVLLLFNQGGALNWVFVVTGILLVIDGVLALVDQLKK